MPNLSVPAHKAFSVPDSEKSLPVSFLFWMNTHQTKGSLELYSSNAHLPFLGWNLSLLYSNSNSSTFYRLIAVQTLEKLADSLLCF